MKLQVADEAVAGNFRSCMTIVTITMIIVTILIKYV